MNFQHKALPLTALVMFKLISFMRSSQPLQLSSKRLNFESYKNSKVEEPVAFEIRKRNSSIVELNQQVEKMGKC